MDWYPIKKEAEIHIVSMKFFKNSVHSLSLEPIQLHIICWWWSIISHWIQKFKINSERKSKFTFKVMNTLMKIWNKWNIFNAFKKKQLEYSDLSMDSFQESFKEIPIWRIFQLRKGLMWWDSQWEIIIQKNTLRIHLCSNRKDG